MKILKGVFSPHADFISVRCCLLSHESSSLQRIDIANEWRRKERSSNGTNGVGSKGLAATSKERTIEMV